MAGYLVDEELGSYQGIGNGVEDTIGDDQRWNGSPFKIPIVKTCKAEKSCRSHGGLRNGLVMIGEEM